MACDKKRFDVDKTIIGDSKKNEIVVVRIPEDVKQMIQYMADKERRTLSNYIRHILIQTIKKSMIE